jgi:hypothetical protein
MTEQMTPEHEDQARRTLKEARHAVTDPEAAAYAEASVERTWDALSPEATRPAIGLVERDLDVATGGETGGSFARGTVLGLVVEALNHISRNLELLPPGDADAVVRQVIDAEVERVAQVGGVHSPLLRAEHVLLLEALFGGTGRRTLFEVHADQWCSKWALDEAELAELCDQRMATTIRNRCRSGEELHFASVEAREGYLKKLVRNAAVDLAGRGRDRDGRTSTTSKAFGPSDPEVVDDAESDASIEGLGDRRDGIERMVRISASGTGPTLVLLLATEAAHRLRVGAAPDDQQPSMDLLQRAVWESAVQHYGLVRTARAESTDDGRDDSPVPPPAAIPDSNSAFGRWMYRVVVRCQLLLAHAHDPETFLRNTLVGVALDGIRTGTSSLEDLPTVLWDRLVSRRSKVRLWDLVVDVYDDVPADPPRTRPSGGDPPRWLVLLERSVAAGVRARLTDTEEQ